jgi:hypothetical protein
VAGHFSKGDKVSWRWGAHTANGEVAQRFERRVQRTIKGERVVRDASPDEPAYLVTQEDGGRALKSGSELHARGGA